MNRDGSSARGLIAGRAVVGVLGVLVAAGAGGLYAVREVTRTLERADRFQAQATRLETSLRDLERDHHTLRARYDDAVRRTAVTELLVDDAGRLAVVVRTSEGVLRRIETPFDPSAEIYVDYAVLDGRLWIRRIFDSFTPPGSALVIDPVVETIDWEQRPTGLGKAVYRSLGPGRWIVTVTGNGSLGLARAAEHEPIELMPQPPVRPFDALVDAAPAGPRG